MKNVNVPISGVEPYGMDLLSKQRDIRSKRSSATPIPLSWLLACFMSHFRAKIRLSKDGRKHFSPFNTYQ